MTRRRILSLSILVAIVIALPSLSHAATVQSGRVLTVSTSTPDNAYYAAEGVNVDAPIPADLSVAAGNLTVSAPVTGEVLVAGGTVDIQKPVGGNARIAAGKINVEDTINGDLIAAGGFITVSGKAKDTRIVGATVNLTNGSNGPVIIYGADVYLSGEFNGDVQVIASDKITLAEGTVIHGAFKYNAPQQAGIPSSVRVDKGVTYIGSAPFLPTVQQAKTFAVAGLWVFYLVRLIASLIAIGLIVGLFPVLTDRVVESALTRSPERFILLGFLGFAGFIVTPIVFLLLLISFVGIGIALIVGAAYLIFLLLSYAFASVLMGAAIMRGVKKNAFITWRGAILGVVVIFFLGFIPVIGFLVKVVLSAVAGGALLMIGYRFAFARAMQDALDF